jgi:hypothetical protein
VRGAAAALLVALAAAGCVTREAAAPSGAPAGTGEGALLPGELVVECDRARVVVPAGAEALAVGLREVRWKGTVVRTREAPIDLESAGSDFTVVAEGIVRLRRGEGRLTVEEGPYGTVVLRNGNLLRR